MLWLLAAVPVLAVTPVVTTTAATGVTDSNASLNGTIDPMGETFEVRAQYGLTDSYGYITQGSSYFFGTGVQNCSFAPSGLATNTTYHYRITATSLDGTRTYVGNDMTFTTLANPPTLGTPLAGVNSLAPTQVSFALYSLLSGSSQTTVSYEYGLTTSYGSEVVSPTQVDKDVIAYSTCFATATGLTPGTTYHFRAKAVNQQATVYSPDYTFTTHMGPVLTPTAPTGVTDLAATINGTANTDGELLNVVFEFGTTTSYGQTYTAATYFRSTSATPMSAQPEGLLPGTTYHYRLKASYYYDSSIVFYGPDQTFTTAAATTPPTAGSMVAVAATPTMAAVACYPVYAGSSETSGTFKYGLTTDYGATASSLITVPLGTYGPVLAELSGLTPGTTYHMTCVLTNAQGSVTATDATFTTASLPVVTTGAASAVQDFSAVLNGDLVITGVIGGAALSFDFGTTASYGTSISASPGTATGPTSFSATASNLQPSTTYHYRARVRFVFSTAQEDYTGPDMTFTTTASSAPTVGNVSASQIGISTATLSVDAVSAGSADATIFWEYQAAGGSVQTIDSSPASVTLGSSTASSVQLTGLQAATLYTYRCGATSARGTTYGAYGSFTTNDNIAPTLGTVYAAQVGVTSTTVGINYLDAGTAYTTVFWECQPVAGGAVQQVSGFPSTLSPGQVVSTEKAVFTQLQPSTAYSYRCGATNVKGTTYSAYGTFTTQGSPTVTTAAATGVTDMTAVLSGSGNASGGGPFGLFFQIGTTTSYGTVISPAGNYLGGAADTPVTATVGHLLPNTTYHYRLCAIYFNSNHTSIDTTQGFYGADQTFTTGAPATPPSSLTTVSGPLATTAARVIADVETGSSPATVVIEYGTDTTYGSQYTSTTTSAAGTRAISTNDISGLLADTDYHFRVVVTNAEGSATGPDTVVHTLAPPTVITTAATSVQPISAMLNGTSNNQGGHYTASFDFGTTTAYGQNIAAGYTLITSGSTLFRYANAQAFTGGVVIGGGGTLVIGGGLGGGSNLIIILPSNITGGNASASGFASYAAIPVTYNGVDSIRYASASSGGSLTTPSLGGFDPVATSTAVAPLLPQTTYHYRLKLSDSYGNTYYGSDATFTTLAPVDAWRQARFSTTSNTGSASDLAAPAGDGLPNLLKYALGMDPTTAATAPQPTLKDYSGTQHLSLTFQRDPAKTDITYEVQTADSPLGPWTTVATSTGGGVTTGPGFVAEGVPSSGGTTGGSVSGGLIIIGVGGGGISGGTLTLPGMTPVYTIPTPLNVEVFDPVSMQDAARRFMRLQVTRQ
ncbi:hypothetical protein [Prosthecobacter vanneervenii]|uniref:Phosphodiesterase/alkaline phosphatase D-like protein n=1 Tax=Prosthecobacter vanneervenii TaxID=48466 RepID=A0A7W7Y832_9BACT|nr:hypothetical protein [Prosthecobacter vanneervenii]MBB5031304.1 phosphodiesterase/alkaline phosphatase D-like protein [Prosthecobacter vanneervenii]